MYVTINPAARQFLSVLVLNALTNLECGNELRKSYEQEIKIEEELELLVEDDGKECKNVVLLISNDVRGIS